MWTLSRSAHALTRLLAAASAVVLSGAAHAQTYPVGQPQNYAYQNYTSGLYLPQVPQPNGQDEIRAADGTSCRSSMASNNAYLDVGGIGGQDIDGVFTSGTLYGRVIVPLGTVPKRLDCSALYDLEITRLRHELELARAGLTSGPSGGPTEQRSVKDMGWADHGWSNSGWRDGSGSGAGNSAAGTRTVEKSKDAARQGDTIAQTGNLPHTVQGLSGQRSSEDGARATAPGAGVHASPSAIEISNWQAGTTVARDLD